MSEQKHTEKKSANLESIIEDEWDILSDLKNTMKNPELQIADKLHVANAIAYHTSVLSKLLAQRGADSQLNEATLGDFIRDVEPRTARRRRVDFIRWTRRLSLRR
jgi:hypothetical protein